MTYSPKTKVSINIFPLINYTEFSSDYTQITTEMVQLLGV